MKLIISSSELLKGVMAVAKAILTLKETFSKSQHLIQNSHSELRLKLKALQRKDA